MISRETAAEILRLYHAEGWRVGSISRQLGIHHRTVKRVLVAEGAARPNRAARPRMIDPYLPFIEEALRRYPKVPASRLFAMVRNRGYPGKRSQFCSIVAELRPRRLDPEPYLRLKTLPGEQAQVDWAHFGRLPVGRAARPLVAFVIVLSYSRAIYLQFFLSQSLSNFLRGHELAFQWFGGLSRVCLYDNLKSVVVERIGHAIRFNQQFMEFAGHCRFEPRPVAIARGNEKGRTERAIRYVRTSFFAARRYTSLDDLNRQALEWCSQTALDRRWPEDTSRTVREVFLEEQKVLMPLPENPFPCDERREVSVGKSPYLRFDLNDYSVPHDCVGKTLVVLASQSTVRALDGDQLVAAHERSYDRGAVVEDEQHIEALAAVKTAAGQHRRINSLSQAVPASIKLLQQLSSRGLPLARAAQDLTELLHCFGASALESAICEALQNDTPHLHAVRYVLERMRQEAGKSPALPLSLPDDPRVQNLVITPHSLSSYDQFDEENNNVEKTNRD